MAFYKIRVAVSVWWTRPAWGSLFKEKQMNAELIAKLSTLNEKEIAYLLGVVDGLGAVATNALEATKQS